MDYKTKTALILPFNGVWIVGNGGRDPLTNNHNRPDAAQNQIFAYDFKKGKKDDGKKLEDYEAFGGQVISPADGVVLQVINGAFDVSPGERDRSVGVGNAIVLDHQNGEYSLLCHFKHNSIKVKVEDKIKQGEVIGLCGNSGNTSEPHIHFNLQNGPFMHEAMALPAQFPKIIVDGEIRTNYEPIRGQLVSNT